MPQFFQINKLCFCLFISALFSFLPSQAYCKDQIIPVFVVGQDTKSINDYMDALPSNATYPDGFMVYTAINELRGLFNAVDQGAGINYADQMLRKYPKMKVVQVGLYMRYMLNEIIQGSFDNNIDLLGQWIKGTGKRVYLRIGYEFDNPENQYDPEQYKNAYRHIVERLKSNGVHNVYFVWHSIAWRDKDWPVYDPLKWYPGDLYVDWVGISFFDPLREEERDAAAKLAFKLNKPLMIAESSPFFQYTDLQKFQYIDKLFDYIKNNHVQFLSYIDVNWDSLPMFTNYKWGDARLQGTSDLFYKWLKKVKRFKGSI